MQLRSVKSAILRDDFTLLFLFFPDFLKVAASE